MSLPILLQQALANVISGTSQNEIQKAYTDLSHLYRENRENIKHSLTSKEQRMSYLAARMPATYEAVFRVLQEILEQKEYEPLISLIDVGAGPGVASWAACELFDSIKNVTLLELNKEMLLLGKQLANNHEILNKAIWLAEDAFANLEQLEPSCLVISSYFYNEVPLSHQIKYLQLMWKKTKQFLVIIDPGTPQCFQSISNARNWFIQQKDAHILAPCSHAISCPALAQEGDYWCHFKVRVQRSRSHVAIKKADKGFEDEKFSYLIVSKKLCEKYSSRIIRHPEKHTGHVNLTTCSEQGISVKTYSKKNDVLYKRVRKAEWGDRF